MSIYWQTISAIKSAGIGLKTYRQHLFICVLATSLGAASWRLAENKQAYTSTIDGKDRALSKLHLEVAELRSQGAHDKAELRRIAEARPALIKKLAELTLLVPSTLKPQLADLSRSLTDALPEPENAEHFDSYLDRSLVSSPSGLSSGSASGVAPGAPSAVMI